MTTVTKILLGLICVIRIIQIFWCHSSWAHKVGLYFSVISELGFVMCLALSGSLWTGVWFTTFFFSWGRKYENMSCDRVCQPGFLSDFDEQRPQAELHLSCMVHVHGFKPFGVISYCSQLILCETAFL